MNDTVRNIPTLEDITPQWLTNILREAGFENVEVSNLKSKIVGTGQMGKCARLYLDFVGSDGGAPKTLIAKFASDDANSRKIAATMGVYKKEVIFYRDLKPQLNIETPNAYYAEILDNGENFTLILDDLAPAEQGDQLEGCSAELTKKAVMQLPQLHAPSWQKADFISNPIYAETETQMAMEHDMYQRSIAAFADKFSDKLSPEKIATFEAVAKSPTAIHGSRKSACALIHMDYRLDNLMIRSDGQEPELSIVDWQTLTAGNPLRDVAYFIATSHTPEERRKIEKPIVETYYQSLLEHGVTNYSWDDCWLDYRWGALAGFHITVVASVSVAQTERGDEMFTLMADRQSQQAIDLNAVELISQ